MASRGLSSGDAVNSLRQTISHICFELVPQAIGLTDAFGFSDWELDRLDLLLSYSLVTSQQFYFQCFGGVQWKGVRITVGACNGRPT